jgi:LytR cell envelope-related transcriptional attenuator
VEHVQPFNRPFPRRTAVLTGLLLAVSLLVAGGLALADREHGVRPVPETSPAGKATPPTPLRPRPRISVLVLNGNGVAHAAGTAATALLAHGYRHAIPADAPNLDYARSLVLFRPGWQREAERLGRDSRIPTVAPLDGRIAPRYAHVPLVLILGAN